MSDSTPSVKSAESHSKKSSSSSKRSSKKDSKTPLPTVVVSTPPISAESSLPQPCPVVTVSGPGITKRSYSLLPPRPPQEPSPSSVDYVGRSEFSDLKKGIEEQFSSFKSMLQPLLSSFSGTGTGSSLPSSLPVQEPSQAVLPEPTASGSGSGQRLTGNRLLVDYAGRRWTEGSTPPQLRSSPVVSRAVHGTPSLASVQEDVDSDFEPDSLSTSASAGGHGAMMEALLARYPERQSQGMVSAIRQPEAAAFLGGPQKATPAQLRLAPYVEDAVRSSFDAFRKCNKAGHLLPVGGYPPLPSVGKLDVDPGCLANFPVKSSQEPGSSRKVQRSTVTVPLAANTFVQSAAVRQLESGSMAQDALFLLATSLFEEDRSLKEEQEPEVLLTCLQSLTSLVSQMIDDAAFVLANQSVSVRDQVLRGHSDLSASETADLRAGQPSSHYVFSGDAQSVLDQAAHREHERVVTLGLQQALKRQAEKPFSGPRKRSRGGSTSGPGSRPSDPSRGRGRTRVRVAGRGRPSSSGFRNQRGHPR